MPLWRNANRCLDALKASVHDIECRGVVIGAQGNAEYMKALSGQTLTFREVVSDAVHAGLVGFEFKRTVQSQTLDGYDADFQIECWISTGISAKSDEPAFHREQSQASSRQGHFDFW